MWLQDVSRNLEFVLDLPIIYIGQGLVNKTIFHGNFSQNGENNVAEYL